MPPIDQTTRQQIEAALNNLGIDAATTAQVEKAIQKWDHLAQPLMEAVSASERLTQEDFAIRINARD